MRSSDTRPIDDLVFEIFRLNNRLIAAGDATVSAVGLTSARWQVLGAAAISPSPLPVAGIARTIGLTRQAVQRLANEMADDALITFEENPRHRRSKLVVLTDSGRAAYETALGLWREQWTTAMEEILPTHDIVETTRRLRRLRGLLQSGTPAPSADDS